MRTIDMHSSAAFARQGVGFTAPSRKEARGWSGCVCAKGGFGKTKEPEAAGKTAGKKSAKQKRRRVKQGPAGVPQQPSPNSREQLFAQRLEDKAEGTEEDNAAFEQRLATLQKRADANRSRVIENPDGGILAAGALSQLSESTQGSGRPGSGDEDDGFQVGLPQVLVGGVSLALVAVFVFTSGFGPGGGPSPQPAQDSSLSQEQRRSLEERSKKLDERLREAPSDVEALREQSDLALVLGDLKKSGSLVQRVTEADPSDTAAWLGLAEARRRLGDNKGAVAAYDRSIEASGSASLPQLQGLAAALVADKRPADAVRRLQSFESGAGAAGAVGPVELQLLIGKVYSQWEKHFASSIAVYDGIIEKFPDDFRGYLARGALLRDNGRKGDAQRMFIQARFLAPPEARSVVDAVSNK